MAEAINYIRNHQEALTLLTKNDDIPLDNNVVEPRMNHMAMGRQKRPKVESIDGGNRIATIMTLINTFNRKDLDPSIWHLGETLLRVRTPPAAM